MSDIKKELDKRGLTEEVFEKIISDCFNKASGETPDIEWQDIIDKYDLKINHDHLRKNCTGVFGSYFVKQYYDEKNAKNNSLNEDEFLAKLDEKKRELEREKIKFRDSRNAWQKQNYVSSRIEDNLDILAEKLQDFGKANFTIDEIVDVNSDNDLIVMLSDLHIGAYYNNMFGSFSSEIAEERLNKYLNKIIEIGKRHNSENCYVAVLGDLISGNIHLTVQLANRENLIEQVKVASELITSFCFKLCKEFKKVFFIDVSGNHSRCVANKDNAVKDERLDDLISWIVINSLSHVGNFTNLSHRKYDTSIGEINVRGKNYVLTHGDYEKNDRSGITSLCSMLGYFPEAILRGHFHSPSMFEYNNVQMIQGGSLCGSGGDYETQKRLVGEPSQTVLVCGNNGVECIYNTKLK